MQNYVPLVPLPERIARLNELAYDLWWTWSEEANAAFQKLDARLWSFTSHNPVLLLHLVSAARMAEAAADPAFVAAYDTAMRSFDAARLSTHTWWQRTFPAAAGTIAYFSAEFAFHRSLPIYAGGLGVLAGDHCKEASDLGVPLVAVGLMYPKGYFHQDVTPDGWQQEVYESLEWSDGPIEPALTAAGEPCSITIPIADRQVRIAVWRVRVGRVMLYLLDTDVDDNAPWDRELSARLYGGNHDGRLQQEIILGIGGVQALRCLGIQPSAWHLNEGHAAFVSVQRIHELVARGTSFPDALNIVRQSTIFIDRHLGAEWRDHQDDEPFWEGVLAIPDEEVWAVRTLLRETLLSFMRHRARQGWSHAALGAVRVVAAGTLLDPPVLTIGFARRFAEYKRSGLIFRDPKRLARILTNARRPAQIVFAGKAHPADEGGKHALQRVYRHAIDPAFGGRVAFVADYDLHVAHYLVQGCDVWLNTPRKPLEASGTSGMKASINGCVNLSIGDGWWAEAYNGVNGWLIDGGEQHDEDAIDAADAESLYWLLEEAVIPAFYDRNAQGVPARWVSLVKHAIRTVMPRFSARRMGKEYAERLYAPALESTAPV